MISGNRILIVGAHPDDGEFGCGGTMARLLEDGADLYYAVFSLCEKSVPEGLSKDILLEELRASAEVLGISPDHLLIHNYEVRTFPTFRQQILEDLVAIRDRINPDVVLVPSGNDLHQDHRTVSEESLRAFKECTIFAYEQAWNNLVFTTTAFVFLTNRHVEHKINCIECYQSQAFRSYSKASFIRSLAEVRGTQIGTEYAEAFEVVRYILR